MKQRHGDLMWRVPRRRDASDDVPANLIVAAEFQSTVDKNMARRMRDYRRMLRESLQRGARGVTLARKSPSVRRDGEDAPAVLPLLVYNGSERWTAPGAVTELPAWSPEAQRILAPFQFHSQLEERAKGWRQQLIAEGVEQGIEQGRAEGVEQGIEQGRVKGVEQGRIEGERTVLRRLVARRFGRSAAPLLSSPRQDAFDRQVGGDRRVARGGTAR